MFISKIIVNLEYEGTHYWETCNINDVNFLKNEHRHIFKITCKKHVSHNDRAIEFIVFKRQILDFLNTNFKNKFEWRSCEDIASVLIDAFGLSDCIVMEDGENGAEICKV